MSEDRKSEEIQAGARREPAFNLPPIIIALTVLLLGIQAVSSFILNDSGRDALDLWLGFIPTRIVAPAQFPGGYWPLIWTPFSYGLVHAGWEHVVGNVVWMVIFGTPVARRYGAGPTLIIFFVASLIGALAFAASTFGTFAYLVGASGGIAGLTGAAVRFIFQPVILVPNPETGALVPVGRRMGTLTELWHSPSARGFSIIWVVLNCLVPLAPLFFGMDVGIAWQAHLGGFFTGLLLVPFFEHGSTHVVPPPAPPPEPAEEPPA